MGDDGDDDDDGGGDVDGGGDDDDDDDGDDDDGGDVTSALRPRSRRRSAMGHRRATPSGRVTAAPGKHQTQR